MAKAQKKEKAKTYFYYGFNITLQSNNRHGEDAYYELIKSIYDKDISPRIAADKAMALKTQTLESYTFEHKKHKVLHGQLIRYTISDKKHWYNKQTKQIEEFNVPDNMFPNGYEASYVFIPMAHRFYVAVTTKVSSVSVEYFLNKALNDVIGAREEIKVNLIQSTDTFEEIISSNKIKNLTVTVSYTNDDIGIDSMELMDKYLKESQVGEMEANFKPDQNGNLKTDSGMVRGFLELAKENGEAEATIVKDDGKLKKILTHNYPEKRPVTAKPTDDVVNILFTDIAKEYRQNE